MWWFSWINFAILWLSTHSLVLFPNCDSSRLSYHSIRLFMREEDLYQLYNIEHFRDPDYDNKLDALIHRNIDNFPKFCNNRVIDSRSLQAFKAANRFVSDFHHHQGQYQQTVILDSGCGKGLSSYHLSQKYPNFPVIGIDRSLSRLSSNEYFFDAGDDSKPTSQKPSNLLLVQADLVDFWLLTACFSNWIVKKHYILHPNPYPKFKHIKQRFYGHPIFPILPVLGGEIVVRSNWQRYLIDFTTSIQTTSNKVTLQQQPIELDPFNSYRTISVDETLTHFDRKYMAVGLPIYETQYNLDCKSPMERQEIINRMNIDILSVGKRLLLS